MMKSPLQIGTSQLCQRGILTALLVISDVTVAASDSGDVIGKALGISVATSIVTTLLTLAVVYFVHKMTRRGKIKRDVKERASVMSSGSTRPLAPHPVARSISYEPVPGQTGENNNVNGDVRTARFKSDFIAKWCTDHKLTENTATVLRRNGFTSLQAITSLQPEDIPRLRLNNVAQECILRETILTTISRRSSSAQKIHKRSNSEEGVNTHLLSRDAHDASGSSGVFIERTHSVDHLDGGPMSPAKPLAAPKKWTTNNVQKLRSNGSMEILSNGEDGDTAIIIYNRSNSKSAMQELPGLVHRTISQETRSNPKQFRGLLSDQGFYDLAEMVGMEYTHLATLLKVPVSKQDQIQLDYPKSTRHQIFEMLKHWRDNVVLEADKATIKGILHKALVKCGRKDLADDLLQEQVEGSCEKVAYHSIV